MFATVLVYLLNSSSSGNIYQNKKEKRKKKKVKKQKGEIYTLFNLVIYVEISKKLDP
jgi:hypothetical protein